MVFSLRRLKMSSFNLSMVIDATAGWYTYSFLYSTFFLIAYREKIQVMDGRSELDGTYFMYFLGWVYG